MRAFPRVGEIWISGNLAHQLLALSRRPAVRKLINVTIPRERPDKEEADQRNAERDQEMPPVIPASLAFGQGAPDTIDLTADHFKAEKPSAVLVGQR